MTPVDIQSLEQRTYDAFETRDPCRLACAIRLLARFAPCSRLLTSLTRALFIVRPGTGARVLRTMRKHAQSPSEVASLASVLIQIGEGAPCQGPEDEAEFRRYFAIPEEAPLPSENVSLLKEAEAALNGVLGKARGDAANRIAELVFKVHGVIDGDVDVARYAFASSDPSCPDSFASALCRYAELCESLELPEASSAMHQLLLADVRTLEQGGHFSVIAHSSLAQFALERSDFEAASARLVMGASVKPCCHVSLRRAHLSGATRGLAACSPDHLRALVVRYPERWRWDARPEYLGD